jgi:DNA-binding beta-propeller fold protein YncE
MKKISTKFVSRCLGVPILAASALAAMVLPSSLSAFTNTTFFNTFPYFPAGMVAAETGRPVLYVAANTAVGLSHLLVINTTFGNITADIALVNVNTAAAETGATQVALNKAGTLAFVVNTGTNTVDIIDITTNSELATLQTPQIGPLPLGVRVSPNGKELWVANAQTAPGLNNGTVSVIELKSGSYGSIAQINTGGSPNEVEFNKKGSAAYVLNGVQNGFVDEINVRKFTILKNFIGEPNLNNPNPLSMDITRDNSTLYIGNFASYVNNVDIPTGTVDNSIFMFPGVGPGAQLIGQVLVSPNQKWVVCAGPTNQTCSVASTKTQAFDSYLIRFGGSVPYFIAFSQDSTTLYSGEALGTLGNTFIDVYTGF